jgi:hypothetical protein
MQATIHTEVRCGECGGVMQYHKESTVLRCTRLKCSQRNIEYKAPTIDLELANKPEQKRGRKAAKD